MGRLLKNKKIAVLSLTLIVFFSEVFCFQNQKPMEWIQPQSINGVLRVHPTNPRYFTDDSGKAIYLTGYHGATAFQDHAFLNPNHRDWNFYMYTYEANNLNYIRLWLIHGTVISPEDAHTIDPFPWVRSDVPGANDGGNKFDLNKAHQGEWDEEFFTKLKNRVEDAGSRGIYVGVMLFESWHARGFRGDSLFYGHIFNEDNNINGINGDLNRDLHGGEIHTIVPEVSKITALQEEFIKKTIDTLHDSDNVLWEIINEADPESKDWQYYMVDFIRQYEISKGYKIHPIGMSAFMGSPEFEVMNEYLMNSSAEWVSLDWNNYKSGSIYGDYINNPPVADSRKVHILDTDHIKDIRDGDEPINPWIWRVFTRGYNPIILGLDDHRDDDTGVDLRKARRWLGDTRDYAVKADITDMASRNDLSSTEFCLAKAGEKYIVYQDNSGSFTVSGLATGQDYYYEWFNPSTEQIVSTGTIAATGPTKIFNPPFSGKAVLYLKLYVVKRLWTNLIKN